MKIKTIFLSLSFFALSLFSIIGSAEVTDEGIDRTFPVAKVKIEQPLTPGIRLTTGTQLTTLFATNNSFAGNTFDVQVIGSNAVIINGFDVNLNNLGTTNTVNLYTRTGTSVGSENTAGAWTLVGTDAAVISAGVNTPSHVNINSIALQPGVTYGFYIDLASYPSSAILYTNGGPTVYADTHLQITTNTGQASPAFSGSFFPRLVNTTLYYTVATPGGSSILPW